MSDIERLNITLDHINISINEMLIAIYAVVDALNTANDLRRAV